MPELFNRRKWQSKIIPTMSGKFKSIAIQINNFPYLEDEETKKRKYIYGDFGFEFIHELHNQLGDFNRAYSATNLIELIIKLDKLDPIYITITGSINNDEKVFNSDIADAITNTLQTESIKP